MSAKSLILGAAVLVGSALALPYEQIDIQSSLLTNPADVAGKQFDYIIAGGV